MNDVATALQFVYSVQLPKEEIKRIREELEEPFDEEDVYFLPQGTRGFGDDRQALAAAYATPRAYSDRLNTVVGPENWFSFSTNSFSPRSQKLLKGKRDWKTKQLKTGEEDRILEISKAEYTVYVAIRGYGLKHNVGDEDAANENMSTTAFAQAFKRACVPHGLGRYFYDFPKVYYRIDENNQWVDKPEIPEWARPAKKCADCGSRITEITTPEGRTFLASQIVANGLKKFQAVLCLSCQKIRQAAATATNGEAAQAAVVVAAVVETPVPAPEAIPLRTAAEYIALFTQRGDDKKAENAANLQKILLELRDRLGEAGYQQVLQAHGINEENPLKGKKTTFYRDLVTDLVAAAGGPGSEAVPQAA